MSNQQPECWRSCHSCQQVVSSKELHEVQACATFGDELDASLMIGAFVCSQCYVSWYFSTPPKKSNGEATK